MTSHSPAAANMQALREKASSSSFKLPMCLLPKHKRDALFTLYATCRTLDDVVDEESHKTDPQHDLAFWQNEMQAVFDGTPTTPLALALQEAHASYAFAPEHVQSLITSMRMDQQGKMCFPSEDEFESYCYGAASAVGLMSMRIFGCDGEHAEPFAVELGHALQCTNILRDIEEDALDGRVYLPKEWCEKAGLDAQSLTAECVLKDTEKFEPVLSQLANVARRHFDNADAHAKFLPAKSIAPALAMRDVYACYLHQLLEQKRPPKVSIGFWNKLSLLPRAAGYLLGRFRPFHI